MIPIGKYIDFYISVKYIGFAAINIVASQIHEIQTTLFKTDFVQQHSHPPVENNRVPWH